MLSKIKLLIALLKLLAVRSQIMCSSLDDFRSLSLTNQGMLPLSSTNAYLGTNLYLARQAENSDILYNFLDSKGAPAAIEIKEADLSYPRRILYYPKVQ